MDVSLQRFRLEYILVGVGSVVMCVCIFGIIVITILYSADIRKMAVTSDIPMHIMDVGHRFPHAHTNVHEVVLPIDEMVI